MPSLDQIVQLLTQYGYLILFPVAILEGPIITVIGGFLASQGIFNPYILLWVVIAADLVGDLLFYALGRWGKSLLIRFFGFTESRLQTITEHYKQQGGRTILIGKVTHSAGFIVLIAAGSAQMPLRSFLWYNLLGTLPKSLIFLLIGYFFGSAYTLVNTYLEKISIIMFFIVVAGVAAYYYFFMQKKNRNKI
jgi:membrane protein DedA with SNARE-associated domain